MENIIEILKKEFNKNSLSFKKKPVLIGGMAKEYYGLRKTGMDIDLVISDEDYQILEKNILIIEKIFGVIWASSLNRLKYGDVYSFWIMIFI
jgi:hypothetical protein